MKTNVFLRTWRFIDALATFPDIALYMWYEILRSTNKEIRKVEIKKSKNIRHGTKKPDFGTMFWNSVSDLKKYRSMTPFGIRLVPSIILGAVVYFIVV